MRVSVVIPTYQRGDILADTMAMALAQDYHDFEVIVVDQSPETPPAVKALIEASAGKPLRYMKLPNPNLPGARNAGVRAATGEIVIFIDDDVVIGPEFVAAYARAFEKKEFGGVMGKTITPGFPEPDLDLVDSQFFVQEKYEDGTARVLWLVGCNCAYRRQAILDAGMSDERFTGSAWGEDADLAIRVRGTGHRLLYDPRIRLTHLALQSGGCANRTAADEEKREWNRRKLNLYLVLKNRSIVGNAAVVNAIWLNYRSYAFNGPLLRTMGRMLKRQLGFVEILIAAAGMVAPAATAARQSR